MKVKVPQEDLRPSERKEPVRMRSLDPPRSTVFDGRVSGVGTRVSDQDGADNLSVWWLVLELVQSYTYSLEATRAEAEASSCDRAQRR